MRRRQTVTPLIVLVTVCAGCASMPPRVGTTPTVELAAGFNLAQLPQAEFPGLTGSIAFIVPKAPTWGAALVADVESSYLIHSRTAGARVYHRSGPLFSERRTVSYFGQLLAGTATGGVQGVLRSEGGLVVEPSVGLDYGAGVRTFHVQVGYRNVRNGAVYDSRILGGPTDGLSGERLTVGMTWRLRAR
jgi:hypothetical protein